MTKQWRGIQACRRVCLMTFGKYVAVVHYDFCQIMFGTAALAQLDTSYKYRLTKFLTTRAIMSQGHLRVV